MESSEKIRCKNCSCLGEKSYRFCNNCGHEIERIKSTQVTCLGTINDKQCNNILTYDARFCQHCGTKNPQYVSEEKPRTKVDCCRDKSHKEDVKEQPVTISSAKKDKPLTKDESCKDNLPQKNVKEQYEAISVANEENTFVKGECSKESLHGKDVEEQSVAISSANKENMFVKGECSKESLHRKDVKEQSVAISSAKKEKSFTEDDCFKEIQQRKDVQEQSVTISEANGIEVGEEIDPDIVEEIAEQTSFASYSEEILKKLRLGDIVSYAKTLAEQANLMKRIKVKVAVAGESGTGKSAFINAIRGVKPDEQGFAKVGFGNTTMTVTKYRHPRNERIVFYDLPGYNTTKMTMELFMKKVSISKFDLFLIFLKAVPTTADKWIIDQLRPAGVKFCFVRAKIDEEMDTAEELGLDQDDVLSEIKEAIGKATKEIEELKEVKIFYISSYEPSIGEMNKLIAFMEEEVAPAKFEAVLYSIPTFTKEVIQKKNKKLKNRIILVAIKFAVFYHFSGNACPNIREEIEMYYRVFDLDKDLAKQIKHLKHRYSEEHMCMHLADFKRQGSDLSSVNKRYRLCKKFMIKLLNELTEDANAMYQHILDQQKHL